MPSAAQQLVFEECKQVITLATERVQRFTVALPVHLEDWKWKAVVQALNADAGSPPGRHHEASVSR